MCLIDRLRHRIQICKNKKQKLDLRGNIDRFSSYEKKVPELTLGLYDFATVVKDGSLLFFNVKYFCFLLISGNFKPYTE